MVLARRDILLGIAFIGAVLKLFVIFFGAPTSNNNDLSRLSKASVCSMLKRLFPRVSVDAAMISLLNSVPPDETALVLNVGLAHGRECFMIAEHGHICRGFEADPKHAAAVQRKAARHRQPLRAHLPSYPNAWGGHLRRCGQW